MADSTTTLELTFHVVNLGCKVNRVESDDFAARLIARGGVEASLDAADFVIVNTCTVTGEAEKKTRKAVRHALRENGHARVVVTGCAAAIDPATYEAMSERVRIVPKGSMVAYLADDAFVADLAYCTSCDGGIRNAAAQSGADQTAKTPEVLTDLSDEVLVGAASLRVGEGFPTRVGVKVQDGCNNACTYCIVHVARGRAWSRPADEIEAEVRTLAAAGAKEIVLTGINLGSYCEGDLRLAGLLRRLIAAADEAAPALAPGEHPVRFRISSVEPRDVDDDLIALMAASDGRICRHLHLPLQSGSAKVLKEMARPYKADYFADLVGRLYAAMPELSLSTDVIVGFPGETEEDFQATMDMARTCRFSKMHIFRYSMREGTPAAKRPDQIAPEIKADRAKRLEALERSLREADRARRVGTTELVLVESHDTATTESYYTVAAPAGARPGDLVECVL